MNRLSVNVRNVLVGRNIKVFSEQEYDHVRAEYGKIMNAFEISKSNDVVADV